MVTIQGKSLGNRLALDRIKIASRLYHAAKKVVEREQAILIGHCKAANEGGSSHGEIGKAANLSRQRIQQFLDPKSKKGRRDDGVLDLHKKD